MSLLTQIIASVSTILILIGGFWAIASNLKKDVKSQMETIEGNFDLKMETLKANAKSEKAVDSEKQQLICSANEELIKIIRADQKQFQEKTIELNRLSLTSHFVSMTALDLIGKGKGNEINGDIKAMLYELRDFSIKKTTS